MKEFINAAIAACLLSTGFATAQQLLVPESTNDQVMLFDANDGSLINANFIDLTLVGAATPIECIQGPDGLYISDQTADTVFKYSVDGTTFVGQISTGLDNVRGIEIAGNTLYVSNSGTGNGAPDDAIVMFDLSFNPLGFFTGADPFDVLDRGTELLVTDLLNEDLLSFDYAGNFLGIFHGSGALNFPEQANNLPGGGVLVGGFSTPSGIYEYDSAGNEVNYWSPATGIRGVYLLGNGLILYTNSSGVHTFDPATGTVFTVVGGISARFISPYDGGTVEPGIQYCPGDGIGTPCPCGNNNDGSMSGCDWMGGGQAGGALSATGSDVYANSDTFLEATNVSGDIGVFFSANGEVTGRTLSDGIRCAGHGLIRMTPPIAPGGSTATHAVPLQTLDPGAGIGVTRYYQYWFRTDPGLCGNLANTTNGYEITWQP